MIKLYKFRHGVTVNFFLRASQSLFAFLYINLQSLGVETSIFSTLLLITSMQALVIFFDFGESTKLIQKHLEISVSATKSLNEELISILRSMMKRLKRVFVIASLNSLSVTIFGIFASSKFGNKYNLINGGAVFVSVFLTFIAWYSSRALIAVGMIRVLFVLQLIAASTQAGFQYVLYQIDAPTVLYFLNTGSAGLTFIVLLFMIFRKKVIYNRVSSKSEFELSTISIRGHDSWSLQFLQTLQVASLITLPILLAWNLSPQNFSTFSFQLKVSFAITAALGAGLVMNWRGSFLDNDPTKLEKRTSVVKPAYQIISVGILVTTITCLFLNLTWDNLFNPQYRPSLISWAFWPLVVSSQLAIWHYFYLLLAKKMYYWLIGGSMLQLTSQIAMASSWNFDSLILAPLLLLIPQSFCATIYVINWHRNQSKNGEEIKNY